MIAPSAADFDRPYQFHLKHLKLKGLQPNTIEGGARAIRRAGDYFDHRIELFGGLGPLVEAGVLDLRTRRPSARDCKT
jgi:hypothetical protein